MSYGIIKVDTVTFTDNSVDKTVSLSGLIQNPTFTGNVTATGTISGDVLRGGTTISGATVTGTTANFTSGVFTTQVSGTTVIATTGTFTSLTGTTTTGTTANFASGVFTTFLGGGLTTAPTAYSVQAGGLYNATNWPNFANNDSGYLGPVFWKNFNGTLACELSLVKSRGTSLGSAGLVLANDPLGFINFIGTDSANAYPCASIQAYTEANVSSSNSPGRLVFGTTTSGTTVISEKLRITNGGTIAYNQPTPTSKSAAATLTVAELQTGIIEYTGAAATLTLSTGTLTEGGFADIYTNMAFQWSVINTGTGICTIGASTAHTIVGGATVAIGASAQFASRRTAANTFVSYRLS